MQFSSPNGVISLEFDPRNLLDLIKRVRAVTRNLVIVTVTNDKSWIAGYDVEESNLAIIQLETSAQKGEGSFIIDHTTIQAACEGRKGALCLVFNKNLITLKAVKGRYTVDLVSKPLTEGTVDDLNSIVENISKESEIMTPDTYHALLATKALGSVNDVFDNKNLLNRFCHAEDRTLTVSSWDNFHMARAVRSLDVSLKKPFRMALNDDYFNRLSAIIPQVERGVKFTITDHIFAARSPDALINLPPMQRDESFSVVDEQIEANTDFPCEFSFLSQRFDTVIRNCCSIYTAGCSIECATTKDSTLKISLKTECGSISDEIKIEGLKGKAAFHIEPLNFLDLIGRYAENTKVLMRVSTNVYALEARQDATDLVQLGWLHTDSED